MPTKVVSTTTAPPVPVVCNICGKPLKKGKSVNAGMGTTCAHNASKRTPAQWQAHYAKHTSPTVPTGFVKLASFKPLIAGKKHAIAGLNVNKLVKCIGRDKASNPPTHPICKPTYVNNVRYVNGWLATTAGLTAIATGNFNKAPSK